MKNFNKLLMAMLLVLFSATLFAQQPSTRVTVATPHTTATPTGNTTICSDDVSPDITLTSVNGSNVNMTSTTNYTVTGTVTSGNAANLSFPGASQTLDGTPLTLTGADLNVIDGVQMHNNGTTDIVIDYTISSVSDAPASCAGTTIHETVTVKPTPFVTPDAISTTPGSPFSLPYTSASTGSTFTVTTLPAGITSTTTPGALVPGGGSIPDFAVAPGTPAGTYNIVITVDNGTCTEDITFPVVVNPTITGFDIPGVAGQPANEISYTTTGVALGDDFRIDFTDPDNNTVTPYANVNTDFINANKPANGGNLFDAAGVSQWVALPSIDGSMPIVINVPSTIPAGVYNVDIYDKKTVGVTDYISAVDQFTITVSPAGSISGGGCFSTPDNVQLTLTGQGPWNVVLNDGTNDIVYNNLTGPSPVNISVSTTGTYTLKSVTENSITVAGSGSATVYKPAVSFINNTTTVCEGSPLDIKLRLDEGVYNANSGWKFEYSTQEGANPPVSQGELGTSKTQEIAIPGNAGTVTTDYLINKVTDANGCVVTWP